MLPGWCWKLSTHHPRILSSSFNPGRETVTIPILYLRKQKLKQSGKGHSQNPREVFPSTRRGVEGQGNSKINVFSAKQHPLGGGNRTGPHVAQPRCRLGAEDDPIPGLRDTTAGTGQEVTGHRRPEQARRLGHRPLTSAGSIGAAGTRGGAGRHQAQPTLPQVPRKCRQGRLAVLTRIRPLKSATPPTVDQPAPIHASWQRPFL